MSVMHQSMCMFKAGLSRLSDGWAKSKEKVEMIYSRFIHEKSTEKLVRIYYICS